MAWVGKKGYMAGQADLIRILKTDGQPEIAKIVEQYLTLESVWVDKPVGVGNQPIPTPKKCICCGYGEPICKHKGKSYSCPNCKAARERFRSKNDEVVK
jgi:hypothetical protein